MDPLQPYFDAIQRLDSAEGTEHTLRGALENLLKAIAANENSNITVIHEPKRDKTKLGAPDFKAKFNAATVGYLETKPIGTNLDKVLQSSQIAKYKRLSGNLILTDYLEWIWLRDGHIIKRETLCSARAVGNQKARLDPDTAEQVAGLIAGFLSTPPEQLGDAKKLSAALAVRCHDLRDFLLEELERQKKESRKGRLYGLYEVFQEEVFQGLTLKEFADAFAQTLGYGLFLAKLNAGEAATITLVNAKQHITANFALLRELVNFLDELDRDEYRGIRWLVEEILSILNTLDLTAIHEDLSFSKRSGKSPLTTDERQLFAKDPYVYFYEDFLRAYDKDISKRRGVYYTPPPVVNFIVRAVNDILKNTFSIEHGLADRKRVTVLDFATGTGTFLLEVLQKIFETVSEGIRAQVVKEHVLKNLYGFEYLIAPYTVAHLKLSQFLHDRGYAMQPGERLNIYLTNTLESIEPQGNLLLPALSDEVKAAQAVKEKPILVITGNPPYNVKSRNKGKWITNLLKDTYFKVDDKKLEEKKSSNLLDDYVKFIRFAQWKMEQVEEGVVGLITNHSFLDNPTFRGMRQSLMQTFNQIYVLDLHGNVNKKEKTPEGSKDENVFDIEQGVAVSLLVKKQGLSQAAYHADLWGKREEKYLALLEAEKDSIAWTALHPSTPFYLFVPQDEELRKEYAHWPGLAEAFVCHGSGIKTDRDDLCTDFIKENLAQRMRHLFSGEYDDAFAERYKVQPSSSYDVVKRARRTQFVESDITRCLYRPFDVRWLYYQRGFTSRPAHKVMRHILPGRNIGLLSARSNKSGEMDHFLCTRLPTEVKVAESTTQSCMFPLYRYPSPTDADLFQGKERIENFSPKFRAFVDEKYTHHYSPEDILGYIYAVLHSPTYREKYRDFLKIDFPRVPFVKQRSAFEALAALGWELVQAHLLKTVPQSLKVEPTPGNFQVERPAYDAQRERLYINKTQYFSPVPQDVWGFHIGGYQVLAQYLKSRKGRALSLDEIENIQNVVNVLRFTIDQMQRIEECWKP